MNAKLTLPLSGGSFGSGWTQAPRATGCAVVQNSQGYQFTPINPTLAVARVSQASGHARTCPEGTTRTWYWNPNAGWQTYPVPTYVPETLPPGVPAAIEE